MIFFIFRSRASLTSDRSSPWTNSFHVPNGGRQPEHDDGGFLNNSGSQRGSFSVKRDSLASREQIPIQGAMTNLTNHHSNRDLSATPTSSSALPSNSLPRSTIEGSYTPRTYTPRSDPNNASLPRNHVNHTPVVITPHNNSSLNRSHSTAKMDNPPSGPQPMPRSHSNMDSLGRGKAMAEVQKQPLSSASLPRSMAMVVNGGSNGAPIVSNGRYVSSNLFSNNLNISKTHVNPIWLNWEQPRLSVAAEAAMISISDWLKTLRKNLIT